MEPVSESVEAGEEKGKVVNKLKVGGGVKKKGGGGKEEGGEEESLTLPQCAPQWREKKGKQLYCDVAE